MSKRLIPFILLLLSTGAEAAQPSSAMYRLVQDGIVAVGGNGANAQFTLHGGDTAGTARLLPAPITARRDVTGTTDDTQAVILVQGAGEEQVRATIVSNTNTFVAKDVLFKLGPNTLTVIAADLLGNTSTTQRHVVLDLPLEKKIECTKYKVTGQTDASAVLVTVNGRTANLNQDTHTYTAVIGLSLGRNTITATAQDAIGNSADATVHVYVLQSTHPPAMPTVGTIGPKLPPFTTDTQITISGTKVKDTSVWVNGQQAAATSDTTWTITLSLREGDNILRVIAKDELGVSSAEAVRNVVVDNEPPVITAADVTTNFNPYTFAGSVDDSLTTVLVNGLLAQREGRVFSAPLSLTYGANAVIINAKSRRDLPSSKTVTVTLGHVPVINTIAPSDGRLLYLSRPFTLQVAATDAENDPREYQLTRGATVMQLWSPQNALSWTPAAGDLGAHLLLFEARDAYGGQDQQQAEVLVIREPVPPPVQP